MRALVILTAALLAPRVVLAQLVAEEVARFELEGVNSLGISMALDSQMVLLGAVGPGAYVFQHDGANWWMDTLRVNGEPWDVTRVSLHGDLALLGAAPVAVLYRYNGRAWVQEAFFQEDELQAEKAVAVGRDVALVVSPSHAVHVYRFDGREWRREARLAPERGEGQGDPHGFARELALDEDRALVLKDSTMGDDFEGTYIFAFDGAAWRQEAVLVIEDAASRFQGAIALDGDVALISVDYEDEVHVFRRDGRAWRREAVLVPPDLGSTCACLTSSPAGVPPCSTEHGDYRNFGVSVAVEGNLALVGAIKGDRGANEGAAYVFRFDGACWKHEISIADPSTWGFGRTVALHESDALIRTNSANRGAYLFRIRELDR